MWLRVADIKDSATPRYSQKWQVAFYGLDTWLQEHPFVLPVRPSDTGVVLTRPVPDATRCWIATSQADIARCQQACIEQLQHWWQGASGRDIGPHLVTFDAMSINLLQEGMWHAIDPHAHDFLWRSERPRYTALRQLVLRHFALPIPLAVS